MKRSVADHPMFKAAFADAELDTERGLRALPPLTASSWRRRVRGHDEEGGCGGSHVDALVPASQGRALGRVRASKRWSALLTAANSRIAQNGVRARLGERRWKAVVDFAESKYRPGWDAAFDPPDGLLACCGATDEAASGCPRGFTVDLRRASAVDLLKCLHLDHEYDVSVVCDVWLSAMPVHVSRWDDGVDRGVLCQLLFGASARDGAEACVRFRCGNGNAHARGPVAPTRGRSHFCHTAFTHRRAAVRAEDLRNPHFLARRGTVMRRSDDRVDPGATRAAQDCFSGSRAHGTISDWSGSRTIMHLPVRTSAPARDISLCLEPAEDSNQIDGACRHASRGGRAGARADRKAGRMRTTARPGHSRRRSTVRWGASARAGSGATAAAGKGDGMPPDAGTGALRGTQLAAHRSKGAPVASASCVLARSARLAPRARAAPRPGRMRTATRARGTRECASRRVREA
jgi:hypothetical protein